jgi:drug/metabolite transporter (DMT)-like permease
LIPTPLSQPKPDQLIRAVVHVCIAFFMFTAMQALGKLLVDSHDAMEIAFYRGLLAAIPCLIYVMVTRQYHLLKTKMPITLMLRVLIGSAGVVMTLGAAQYLPIANATVLFFMSTLLIPVLSHFVLHEKIGPHRWIAVAIGMTGVLIAMQPSAQMTLIGVALALGAATVHAIIQVLIRSMKSESTFTITFYFFLSGIVLGGVFMPWVYDPLDMDSAILMLGIGITGGLGQYFLTSGFKMAPASFLGPFNYTGLIWATMFDIMIWQHVPGYPVFLGGAIIIASNFYILYREKLAEKRKAQEPSA